MKSSANYAGSSVRLSVRQPRDLSVHNGGGSLFLLTLLRIRVVRSLVGSLMSAKEEQTEGK